MPNHNFIQVNNIRLVWSQKNSLIPCVYVYKKEVVKDINDGVKRYDWIQIKTLFKDDINKIDNITLSLKDSLLITIYRSKFNEILNYNYFDTKPQLGRLFLNKIYSSIS